MVRDREVLGEIRTVHADNLGVYGARKVHAELHRKGIGDTRALERLLPRHFQQLMSSVVSQRLWLLAQIPAIADSGLLTPELLPTRTFVTSDESLLASTIHGMTFCLKSAGTIWRGRSSKSRRPRIAVAEQWVISRLEEMRDARLAQAMHNLEFLGQAGHVAHRGCGSPGVAVEGKGRCH
ncbi:transposase [Gordonia rubripertincta]|uniref:transposase n=1 Tax=Gordonia rubripertincta TaxID=36822 RepID=UPI0036F46A8E